MLKALIVHEIDETEENRSLFYEALTEAKHEVIYAETGVESIEIAKNNCLT